MTDEDNIPEFLKLSPDERKKAWELNPPKPKPTGWRTSEQEEAERKRLQKLADEKRMQRCVSKQKKLIRSETLEVHLSDRKSIAEGKEWDARTARWIDPIEKALKPQGDKKMTSPAEPKKRTKKEKAEDDNNLFGFRSGTNYRRMMDYLLRHVGQWVPVDTLAKEAYGDSVNLEKHSRRVQAMARKVQEKVIDKKKLSYNIQKEKKENAISIGLFTK